MPGQEAQTRACYAATPKLRGVLRQETWLEPGVIPVAYRLQAKLDWRGEPHLGTARIRFEDLEIYPRTSDGASVRAYLAGFDESLTLFGVYRAKVVHGTTAVDVGANLGIHQLGVVALRAIQRVCLLL
jgi:hypothetical protein